jgi:hypothetical protein
VQKVNAMAQLTCNKYTVLYIRIQCVGGGGGRVWGSVGNNILQ